MYAGTVSTYSVAKKAEATQWSMLVYGSGFKSVRCALLRDHGEFFESYTVELRQL